MMRSFVPCSTPRLRAVATLLGVVLTVSTARSQPTLEPRVELGKVVSAAGTVLTRSSARTAWHTAATVFTRDELLTLPGVQGAIEPTTGVRLTLYGNMPSLSPSLALESLVVLHDSRGYDLDFTLIQGRVLLTNQKANGPVRIWVRFRAEGWEITLPEPGASVGLEVYGRWPAGVPFSKDPNSVDRPTSYLRMLALHGRVELKTASREHTLTAGSGPQYFHWDSVEGEDDRPRTIKTPAWADPKAEPTPDAKLIAGIADKYLGLVKGATPADALATLLDDAAKDKDEAQAVLTRQFAVLGFGALGDLPRVVEGLADPGQREVRTTASLALRNFIASAPGRDLQLYQLLQTVERYTPAQAAAVLQLLHSPFDPNQAETYETLIAYLQHDKLAVRELARWHLYELVEQGRGIAYDAAGTPEQRAKAVGAWKQLIPEGKVPEKAKPKQG
jgi:hypothetical protein